MRQDSKNGRSKETEAYITMKSHKQDFSNKISCRLINPLKPSIGKVSKSYSWQDQPPITTDNKNKPMEGLFKRNWMV